MSGYRPTPMTRRIFLDTEWTAAPWSSESELMWIGLADEEGRVWSAISADAEIDPATNDFIAGAFSLISPDDLRLPGEEIASGVVEFCGAVDEFWAWIPTLERFADWFGLGADAADIYARYRDWDLQVLRSLVDPWPEGWPTRVLDLNAAAVEAGVALPPRAANHLNPEVHAAWNRELFARIREARAG
jgi:hypothetical protein